ncbi:heme oxygenase (biliverdin-producing, ferredoxin) [Ranunculus cassubicifolius]
MASTISISQSRIITSKTQHNIPKAAASLVPAASRHFRYSLLRNKVTLQGVRARKLVIVSAATTETPKTSYPGEEKGFVEELRFVALKLHTKDQSKKGEREADLPPLATWEPSIKGYLRFLVDSKLVYDTLETILQRASYLSYADLRNTGLERSEKLAKDLKWFKEQGHAIPEPSAPGISYAPYLEELSEKDPHAFICHFYNLYFGHAAGGRIMGKNVAAKILNRKELEFYKWDGDLSQVLNNAREKLNTVAQSWLREEKNRCLEETETSFNYYIEILRLILSCDDASL